MLWVLAGISVLARHAIMAQWLLECWNDVMRCHIVEGKITTAIQPELSSIQLVSFATCR